VKGRVLTKRDKVTAAAKKEKSVSALPIQAGAAQREGEELSLRSRIMRDDEPFQHGREADELPDVCAAPESRQFSDQMRNFQAGLDVHGWIIECGTTVAAMQMFDMNELPVKRFPFGSTISHALVG
jgi:hypothetical protein